MYGLLRRTIVRVRGGKYSPPPSCQIPLLRDIYLDAFGFRRKGTFVEVGAFDGESFSNTCFLADLGWRGIYIEPIPAYAARCAKRHEKNDVSVVQCAIGSDSGVISISVSEQLSTCDKNVFAAYERVKWAQRVLSEQQVEVPQRTLVSVLEEERVSPGFDLLVIDVEGFEFEVLRNFDLGFWRPRLLIVELEDTHPDFQGDSDAERNMRRQASMCRELLSANGGYETVYRDTINTVFRLTESSL